MEDPQESEVLVKMIATGICHTDLCIQDGSIPNVPLPAILGHEGVGTVDKVGSGVKDLAPGDKVMLSFNYCGACKNCDNHTPAWGLLNFACPREGTQVGVQEKSNEPVRGLFFGQSSFAAHSLVARNSCVKLPASTSFTDDELAHLAPFGCGIQTGAGSVLTGLDAQEGSSIGVWGMGGVGISSVIAARTRGCRVIVAVDIVPDRLELARKLGATHTVDGRDGADAVQKAISDATNGKGLDYTIDATGNVKCIEAAVQSLAIFGTHGQVGVVTPGKSPAFDMNDYIMKQKKMLGLVEGNVVPAQFLPKLIEMRSRGDLPIESFSRIFPVEKFQDALDAMHNGSVVKPILRF